MDFTVNLDGLRKSFYQAAQALEKDAPKLARVSERELNLRDRILKTRAYYPLEKSYKLLPAIVFFHGGGFILGDLDSHDMICRRLCAASGCVVISVEYRKAPNHTFPSAHDDAVAAWLSIHKGAAYYGIDCDLMSVGGDSAGGNLAVHVAREMAETGGPKPQFMLLYYPLLQFSDVRSAPLDIKQTGLSLSPRIFEYFRDSYMPHKGDWADIRVSPLFMDLDMWRHFPPAHFVTSEWDPLTVEINVFVDNLKRFGVDVSCVHYDNTAHGFLNLTAFIPKAKTAIEQSGQVLASALSSTRILTDNN